MPSTLNYSVMLMLRIALFENRAILCRKHDCTHRAFRFLQECHEQFLS